MAITPSADDYKGTFGNGYAFSGHDTKDKATQWAQAVESSAETLEAQAAGTTASLKLDTVEIVAATNAITVAESGKVFVLNHATEFASTLPAVADSAGVNFKFIIGAAPASANYTIVTGNTHENKIYGCIQESETDTTEDGPTAQAQDTITFNDGVAVVGDYVDLVSDGVNWYVSGMTAADGGIAFSTT